QPSGDVYRHRVWSLPSAEVSPCPPRVLPLKLYISITGTPSPPATPASEDAETGAVIPTTFSDLDAHEAPSLVGQPEHRLDGVHERRLVAVLPDRLQLVEQQREALIEVVDHGPHAGRNVFLPVSALRNGRHRPDVGEIDGPACEDRLALDVTADPLAGLDLEEAVVVRELVRALDLRRGFRTLALVHDQGDAGFHGVEVRHHDECKRAADLPLSGKLRLHGSKFAEYRVIEG